MASGKEHENSIKVFALPFGITISLLLGFESGVLAGFSFLIGGFWLSPDLDTNSIGLKRWGILKILWLPYKTLIPHRSILSHGPIVGTTLRVLYLISIASFILFLLDALEIISMVEAEYTLRQVIKKYPSSILAIIIGIEASAWLHLIKDGDPPLIKWRKSKRR